MKGFFKIINMMWIVRGFYFILILFIVGCGGVSDNPSVNLPVPFAAPLSADSNLLVAEGNPIGVQSASINSSLRQNQTQTSGFPISWELINSALSNSCGTMTIKSISDPTKITPLPGGGEQREYMLSTSLQASNVDFEVDANNMQCFENRTPYAPTPESVALASSIGGTADVRKLACSGPIQCVCPGNTPCNKSACVEGNPLTFDLVTDVIVHPDGKTSFNSQRESNIIFDGRMGGGASFCVGTGNEPKAKVLMTLILQGFPSFVPPDQIAGAPPVMSEGVVALYLPGSNEVKGLLVHHIHNVTTTFDSSGGIQQFDTDATSDFYVGTSFLRVRTIYEHTYVPELDDPFDQIIKTTELYFNDPNFTDTVFSINGGRAYHQTALETVNIDFDSSTGIFRDLFDQFGPYNLQSRCLVKSETVPPHSFNLMPLIITLTQKTP
jgi:hypothetical protein